jgi:hypothetical protein
MAQPTSSDVHIDAALSAISVGYRNSGYIADSIFPMVRVEKQSDKFYTWTKDFWFRNYVQRRTPGDTYPEGGLELSNQAFFCNIFHLAFPLNDEDVQNQDAAIELEITGAEWLADQFMLNREASMVADFFKTGVWGTDVTLAGGDQWSDFANSDPEADIRTGTQTLQKNTGTKGNKLIIGPEVRDKLAQHPLLLDKYKYTNVAILSNEQIAGALVLPQIVVGEAVDNTAQEGATFSGEFTWGKSAMLLQVADRPGRRVPSAGYTFVWPVDGSGELNVTVSRLREDTRDRDLLRAKHAFDQKAVATDLGYFIAAAVA